MALYEIGVTYRGASQDERGALACGTEAEALIWEELLGQADEVLILNTCARFEVYVAGPHVDLEEIESVLLARSGFSAAQWERMCERREEQEAVRHLFRVAAGLDSEIVGEGEILRQVKEAADEARRRGALSGELGLLTRSVVAAAKEVRERTGLAEGALSVGSLAAQEAERALGALHGRAVLVIGAGEVARLVLQHLGEHGVGAVSVVSRSRAHAEATAEAYRGARALDWEEIDRALAEVDVVLSATSAPHLILDLYRLEAAMRQRRQRRLVVFDLAQPRDVDPRVAGLKGVVLFDLAELGRRAEVHRALRAAEVRRAEALLAEAESAFYADLAARRAAPLIRALSERADGYLTAELARLFRKEDFTPEEERAVSLFAHRLVRKLLNDVTLGLREEAQREGESALEVARRLLRLPQPPTEEPLKEGGRL
jgi:glutamyl-tRNA reductase